MHKIYIFYFFYFFKCGKLYFWSPSMICFSYINNVCITICRHKWSHRKRLQNILIKIKRNYSIYKSGTTFYSWYPSYNISSSGIQTWDLHVREWDSPLQLLRLIEQGWIHIVYYLLILQSNINKIISWTDDAFHLSGTPSLKTGTSPLVVNSSTTVYIC